MALLILLFVLLANFLLRSMDKFLGKGLDTLLILEFVFLNLAWILALAVPMAILISTLMAYGRFSSDNEIAALRSLSISYIHIISPALLFSIFIAGTMIYFNNQILPEMNHKARKLSSDINRKRPDLNFDVGYFIDDIPKYNFLLGGRDGEYFKDIIIFSNNEIGKRQTIIADSGTISTINNGFLLNLINGVIHEYISNSKNEYREIYFDKYNVKIPVENMVLSRKESSIRGDREMTYYMIKDKIKSYERKIQNTQDRIKNRLVTESKKLNINYNIDTLDIISPLLANKILGDLEDDFFNSIQNYKKDVKYKLERRMKNLKRGVNSDISLINSYDNSISKYLVELHKKFSIPFASIIFILIGAPLGIISKRSGFAVSTALSLGFFIIYWAFLIGGEEFADRGLISPMLSMWFPNILLGLIGVILCYLISTEKKIINFSFLDFLNIKRKYINND